MYKLKIIQTLLLPVFFLHLVAGRSLPEEDQSLQHPAQLHQQPAHLEEIIQNLIEIQTQLEREINITEPLLESLYSGIRNISEYLNQSRHHQQQDEILSLQVQLPCDTEHEKPKVVLLKLDHKGDELPFKPTASNELVPEKKNSDPQPESPENLHPEEPQATNQIEVRLVPEHQHSESEDHSLHHPSEDTVRVLPLQEGQPIEIQITLPNQPSSEEIQIPEASHKNEAQHVQPEVPLPNAQQPEEVARELPQEGQQPIEIQITLPNQPSEESRLLEPSGEIQTPEASHKSEVQLQPEVSQPNPQQPEEVARELPQEGQQPIDIQLVVPAQKLEGNEEPEEFRLKLELQQPQSESQLHAEPEGHVQVSEDGQKIEITFLIPPQPEQHHEEPQLQPEASPQQVQPEQHHEEAQLQPEASQLDPQQFKNLIDETKPVQPMLAKVALKPSDELTNQAENVVPEAAAAVVFVPEQEISKTPLVSEPVEVAPSKPEQTDVEEITTTTTAPPIPEEPKIAKIEITIPLIPVESDESIAAQVPAETTTQSSSTTTQLSSTQAPEMTSQAPPPQTPEMTTQVSSTQGPEMTTQVSPTQTSEATTQLPTQAPGLNTTEPPVNPLLPMIPTLEPSKPETPSQPAAEAGRPKVVVFSFGVPVPLEPAKKTSTARGPQRPYNMFPFDGCPPGMKYNKEQGCTPPMNLPMNGYGVYKYVWFGGPRFPIPSTPQPAPN